MRHSEGALSPAKGESKGPRVLGFKGKDNQGLKKGVFFLDLGDTKKGTVRGPLLQADQVR